MSRILVVTDKWSTTHHAADDDATLEASAAKILTERIDDGYWYDADETRDAERALTTSRAWEFLKARSDDNYEYEFVELTELI